MKVSNASVLQQACAAITLLCASSTFAATSSDQARQTYACAVLGDSRACQPKELPDAVDRLVPGSYAQYLIYIGSSVDRALETARGAGEQPTLQRAARPGPMAQLSGTELHERFLGMTLGRASSDAATRSVEGSA